MKLPEDLRVSGEWLPACEQSYKLNPDRQKSVIGADPPLIRELRKDQWAAKAVHSMMPNGVEALEQIKQPSKVPVLAP